MKKSENGNYKISARPQKESKPNINVQKIFAVAGAIGILGLAVQGARQWIANVSPEQSTSVALVIVVFLAYIVYQGNNKAVK